jgi:hypothetical protein
MIFDLVKEWNTEAGHTPSTKFVVDYTTQKQRFRIFLEEVLEYGVARGITWTDVMEIASELYQKGITKPLPAVSKANILDARADMMFVLIGDACSMGITEIEDQFAIEEVIRSNNTKFSDDLELMKRSIDAIGNGIKEVDVHKTPSGRYVLRNRLTNKIVKPLCYEEPNLNEVSFINWFHEVYAMRRPINVDNIVLAKDENPR